MKRTILSLCIIFTSIAAALADTIGAKCDLKSVVSIDIAEEQRSGDDQSPRSFIVLQMGFSEHDEVNRLKDHVAKSALEEPGMSPFALVGDFCHLILRNKDRKPLYIVTIVDYHCVCEIRRAKVDTQERIVIDEGSKDIYGFVSADLVTQVYSAIKKRDRGYLDKIWATPDSNELLEHEADLLSPDERVGAQTKSEQDGGGQPATRPESK